MKHTIAILSFVFVLTITAVAQSPASQQAEPEKLTDQQLLTLVASAKTPAEHERIAQYYVAESQEYLTQSKEHAEMAAQYKKNTVTNSSKFATSTVNHCEYFAKSLAEKADRMRDLSKMHYLMAKDAGQK